MGEVISFFGIQEKGFFLSFFLLVLLSNTILMSFWVGVKTSFGNRLYVSKFSDLTFTEMWILCSLLVLNLVFALLFTEEMMSLISYEVLFL